MFSVSKLTVLLAQKPLVLELDWAVQSGERWVILGANGCGKSSLLAACASLPLAGRQTRYAQLNIGPYAQTNSAPFAPYPWAHLGFCPQRLDWSEQLTPMQLAGLLGADTQLLKLPQAWLSQAIGARSGGEQQRIAIELTLARSASLCFFDEPLTHLDEVMQHHVLNDLSASGKTLVMVSHHLRLSVQWATHLLMPTSTPGVWRQGAVSDMLSPEFIAQAYQLTPLQAQRLIAGDMLF